MTTNRTSTRVLQSVASKLIRYAKHAIKSSKYLKNKTNIPTTKSKKLMSSISNRAIRLCHRKKKTGKNEGVWQKEILMGDKCEPLDFSGVIYYDKDGNLLTEVPTRSRCASPLPGSACSTPAKSSWVTTSRFEDHCISDFSSPWKM
ncbi:hypothetical protein HanIR_Chr02g0068021 [Helianthus annuus]|nr:hypothetical protein HanIR_Chr02g0068021 [Helianthus annuus]